MKYKTITLYKLKSAEFFHLILESLKVVSNILMLQYCIKQKVGKIKHSVGLRYRLLIFLMKTASADNNISENKLVKANFV